jgi:hypothetical protein
MLSLGLLPSLRAHPGGADRLYGGIMLVAGTRFRRKSV